MMNEDKEALAVVRALMTARGVYQQVVASNSDKESTEALRIAKEDIVLLTNVIVAMLGHDPYDAPTQTK